MLIEVEHYEGDGKTLSARETFLGTIDQCRDLADWIDNALNLTWGTLLPGPKPQTPNHKP